MFHWICKWFCKPDESRRFCFLLKNKKRTLSLNQTVQSKWNVTCWHIFKCYFLFTSQCIKKKMTSVTGDLLWERKSFHSIQRRNPKSSGTFNLGLSLQLSGHEHWPPLAWLGEERDLPTPPQSSQEDKSAQHFNQKDTDDILSSPLFVWLKKPGLKGFRWKWKQLQFSEGL